MTMYYTIQLHQSSGENQTEYQSESWEQIQKDWEYAKKNDDYSEMDEEITLRKSTKHWDDDDYNDVYDIFIC